MAISLSCVVDPGVLRYHDRLYLRRKGLRLWGQCYLTLGKPCPREKHARFQDSPPRVGELLLVLILSFHVEEHDIALELHVPSSVQSNVLELYI